MTFILALVVLALLFLATGGVIRRGVLSWCYRRVDAREGEPGTSLLDRLAHFAVTRVELRHFRERFERARARGPLPVAGHVVLHRGDRPRGR